MEQKIIEVLKQNPRGLKAKEIATSLHMERSEVNSILYRRKRVINDVDIDRQYKWKIRNQLSNITENETRIVDSKLNKICLYYLNCIALDGANTVSVFRDSQFALDYIEIDTPDINALNDESVVNFMLNTSQMQRKVMYVGYPTCVYTIRGSNGNEYKKIAPVFLFQINYDAGNCTMMPVPSINMEILKQYGSSNENERLQELIRLEDELGLNALEEDVDIIDIAQKIYHTRTWKWQEEIDPENLNTHIMSEIEDDGIYNKAILLRTDASQYTQGLEHELVELSRMSEDQYRQTALYDWIHSNVDEKGAVSNEQLLEVLPLNAEQTNSIKTALSSKLTVITGPPGTGKSQVVTNLIVNLAWKGRNAIFSSKNNKAVDVVEKRVNGLTNRPIMLRMGSNQEANALVTFLTDMLAHRQADGNDKGEYQNVKQLYDSLQLQIDGLIHAKENIIKVRNELDLVERGICSIRNEWDKYIPQINAEKLAILDEAIEKSLYLYDRTQYQKQNIIIKLIWKLISKSRIDAYNISINELNDILLGYNKSININNSLDSDDLFPIVLKIQEDFSSIVKYKNLLSRLRGLKTLEEIDKNLISLKKELSDVALQLWNQWIKTIGFRIPLSLRRIVANYIATISLLDGDTIEDNAQLYDIQRQIREILPICAVTSLSVNRRIPFVAGMYNTLIIDEASQCDIPSILPLLYRCKSSVIIGDSKQLNHITGLSKQQDINLLNKYGISPRWSYNAISLYGFAESICNPSNIIKLKDHHRCHGDIIEFSNQEFYGGDLRIATNYSYLKHDYALGVRWINVEGRTCRPYNGSAYNKQEIEEIVKQLKHLVLNNYKGSIGVVTPFKAQAERINRLLEQETELYNKLLSNNMFLADTVHKFQGDEKDLIIFSTVISNGTMPGAISFLKNTGNLFNVAITRAKSTLLVVGDKEFCSHCDVSYLKHFVSYVRNKEDKNLEESNINSYCELGEEYPQIDGALLVSDWEKVLYSALYKVGIKTYPQYHIDKYYLDLALFYNGKCLDIEVDGEQYHRNWNGELCYKDQLRNQRLFELGWDVKRFWVYEIRDNLSWCIEQIKLWMNA